MKEGSNESFYNRLKKRMRGSARRSKRKVANCCVTSWNWTREAFITAWDWFVENVLCCFEDESESEEAPKTPASPRPRTAKATSIERPPEKMVKHDKIAGKLASQIESKERLLKTSIEKPIADASKLSKILSDQPTPPKPKGHITQSHISHPHGTIEKKTGEHEPVTTEQAHLKGEHPKIEAPPESPKGLEPIHSQASKVESPTNEMSPRQEVVPARPDPPKIDFVETGSIFGDRKKATQPNLVLLEDGRFKAPGHPVVTQGPGGRTIRMSFRTGFPKRPAALKDPRSTDSGGSDYKVGKYSSKSSKEESKKSLKSYKSTMSRASKDGQPDIPDKLESTDADKNEQRMPAQQ